MLPRLKPMNVHHLVLAAFAATICAHASPAVGQQPRTVSAVAQWALEEVRLDDGKVLKGLIESEDEKAIEFIQVLRPRGRRMFLVVRTIDKDHIESQRKLGPKKREILIRRINMVRNRVRINRQRLKQVHLTQDKDSEKPSWDYQGKWFSLHSTTDEQHIALSKLLKYLTARFEIPMTFVGDIDRFISKDESRDFVGILSHSNIRKDKFDMGGVDWERINAESGGSVQAQ